MKLEFKERDWAIFLRFVLPAGVFILLTVVLSNTWRFNQNSHFWSNPTVMESDYAKYWIAAIVSSGLFFFSISIDYALFQVQGSTQQKNIDVLPYFFMGIPFMLVSWLSFIFVGSHTKGGDVTMLICVIISFACMAITLCFLDKKRWKGDGWSLFWFIPALGIMYLFSEFKVDLNYFTLVSIFGFVLFLFVRMRNFGFELTVGRIFTGMLILLVVLFSLFYIVQVTKQEKIVWKKTQTFLVATKQITYSQNVAVDFSKIFNKPKDEWSIQLDDIVRKSFETKYQEVSITVPYTKIVDTLEMNFPTNLSNDLIFHFHNMKWKELNKLGKRKSLEQIYTNDKETGLRSQSSGDVEYSVKINKNTLN